MWKAFQELRATGWITDPPPRMYAVQAAGCAPVVRAFSDGADRATAWPDPRTAASGLRVPAPLGDRLIIDALRASGGEAIAVTDEELLEEAHRGSIEEGIDLSPEGGAAIAGARNLRRRGLLRPSDRVVVFNTGAGWLYRSPAHLPRERA
jgi:threonine synthase